ncbi:g5012 [Coccomyxa elongata]
MAAGPAAGVPAVLGTPPPAVNNGTQRDEKKSASKTVTDTIIGEHEHTIIGYSLVKGIGDGEPIASERFTVGGHEWVLLFYPDGKRSSSTEGGMGVGMGVLPGPPGGGGGNGFDGGPPPALLPPPAVIQGAPPAAPVGPPPAFPAPQNPNAAPANNAAAVVARANAAAIAAQQVAQVAQHAAQQAAGQQGAIVAFQGNNQVVAPQQQQQQQQQQQPHPQQQHQQQHQVVGQHGRRELTNDYAALFVALIGESDSPQGVVNTSDGRVVRAFHRFTLVDQSGGGRDLMKGRSRQQGAVKISCARQDPNARNCHGYRKFVKRSVLENLNNGYLVNDTIVIRYTIELVVSTGGALTRQPGSNVPKLPLIQVPSSTLGTELGSLLENGEGADVKFKVDDEELAAHRIILMARSPVFHALLNSEMREGVEGVVTIEDVRGPVFRALLHFVYTDCLPEELEGTNLDVAMAQHLLVAADRFQLSRLRQICERRLCETVEVDSVATTLSLAEQNHAEELKRVCLEFVSRNLQVVMVSEGYQHMVSSCPQLQAELLHVIAVDRQAAGHRSARHAMHRGDYAIDMPADAPEAHRRVRPRRE